jgi:glutathione S-transferase
MTLTLYAHPFSSYCQKVLIALYENDHRFDYRHLGPDHPDALGELRTLWPIGKFPVLVDDGVAIIESSIIIEHLGLHHPGLIRLLPAEPKAALEVRFMDRFFDNYVMSAMQVPVAEALRAEGGRKEAAMAEARNALDLAYAWLDARLAGRAWAVGDVHACRLCGRARALLRGLGSRDQSGLPRTQGLPQPAARAPVLRARR